MNQLGHSKANPRWQEGSLPYNRVAQVLNNTRSFLKGGTRAMIKCEAYLVFPLQHGSCGKTEPEHLFLMSVCRKWILRRWSDGLMMAVHLTMRLCMTRGAFPPSSF